jgi:hypothetical protein
MLLGMFCGVGQRQCNAPVATPRSETKHDEGELSLPLAIACSPGFCSYRKFDRTSGMTDNTPAGSASAAVGSAGSAGSLPASSPASSGATVTIPAPRFVLPPSKKVVPKKGAPAFRLGTEVSQAIRRFFKSRGLLRHFA